MWDKSTKRMIITDFYQSIIIILWHYKRKIRLNPAHFLYPNIPEQYQLHWSPHHLKQ